MIYKAQLPDDYVNMQQKARDTWHIPTVEDYNNTVVFALRLFIKERIRKDLDTVQKIIVYKFLINLERS
jgi:hypothetical protein